MNLHLGYAQMKSDKQNYAMFLFYFNKNYIVSLAILAF